MLKKKYRLALPLQGKQENFSTPYFNLKIGKNNLEVSRFAFIVSKKIDNRSTVRNSLKRKIRGVIEEMFDKINTGNDFAFYPKRLSAVVSRDQIQKEIKKLFEKNQFLKQ